MTLDTVTVLTLVVGTLIPILNGLLTKASSQTARTYLQLVLNAAAGFGAEWLDAAVNNTPYNVGQAALTAVLSLVVAITTQAGVWRPLGVSEWAKTHGNTPAEHRLP
jgi:hypothetical protein